MASSRRTDASGLHKRSLVLNGHPTSVAIEPAFWDALARWAEEDGTSVPALIAAIDGTRTTGSLASALRVAALARAGRQSDGPP